MSKSSRSLAVVLALLAVIAGLVSGCSPRPSADTLEGPAKEVSSAVRAASLAVDLRMTDSTTASAASTAADDMLGEVEAATDKIHGFDAPTQEERTLRNDVLASFSAISRALLHARDVLTASSGEPAASSDGQARLATVQAELRTATDQLDSLMTKAGIQ
ncbi:hypothetical protein [Arthrobacter sp. ISL-95]|uniref:hypothetical protein n=1 Tax=Arthrobacter sp. ISL-95 TaxID=2819116 RepID=UPI001BE76685|nr:hypothetical protein [Arthrobacter sp. ISL-95]MBT2586651.1 hypothetical protein [Arthrobacter sp. ISL-95]